MKKIFFFAVSALTLASCSTEGLVDDWFGGGKDGAISFVMGQKNMTRSYQDMQKTGHYNFGVFAYKSTETVTPVMPNYLVGYYDENNAYQQSGTTVGDPNGLEDGLSYWMYEGMGNAEYNGTYAGEAITDMFKSNNANQYLKFWDNSAATTAFYAYAPYINGAGTVTYVDGTAQDATGGDTYVMCFPNGTIEAQMVEDGESVNNSEYMYSFNKVAKANYGHDVALNFKRLNAKVNIKFWEDVPGYKVRILNLKEGEYTGVQAAAAVKNPNHPEAAAAAPYNTLTYGVYGYAGGKFYSKNGVKIRFATTPEVVKQFVGTEQTNATPLVFTSPVESQIGETRFTAAQSPSTYYAIPKGQGENLLAGTTTDFSNAGTAEDAIYGVTGLTFHVSYELTAEDTGERIVVKNATVHVPYDYCNWKANTHYTYIFKITRNSNGSTEENPTIDPTDPEVPEVQALYPIVFDNCTVEDWDEIEGEWNISDGDEVAYHDIQLSAYSLATNGGTIHIDDITDKDTYAGHGIDWAKVKVYDPAGNEVNYYVEADHNIVVPATAAAGVYTVEYTCPAPANAHVTHPMTWTETFWVGNAYTLTTDLEEVATNGGADAALVMTATKDGSNVTAAAAAAHQIKIGYPDNFTPEQKANVYVDETTGKVVVKKEATPGTYQLVYTVDEGKTVMVAKKEFNVVDKNFTLTQTNIVNKAGGNKIYGSQNADATHVYTVEGPTGHKATVTAGTNEIVIANGSAEGTYTVTYTVNGGTASEVVYTKEFTVKNQYGVTLSKDYLNSMVGTSADGEESTDAITVSLTKNLVATSADFTSKLKVVAADAENTVAGDANFSFTWDGSANTYTLKVKRGAAKKQYKVVYTGQTGVYAVKTFIVQ